MTTVQVVLVIQGNKSIPPELGAQLRKPWKTLLLSSMMKSATRSIQAIGMVWFMSGLTDALLSLFLSRVFSLVLIHGLQS